MTKLFQIEVSLLLRLQVVKRTPPPQNKKVLPVSFLEDNSKKYNPCKPATHGCRQEPAGPKLK